MITDRASYSSNVESQLRLSLGCNVASNCMRAMKFQFVDMYGYANMYTSILQRNKPPVVHEARHVRPRTSSVVRVVHTNRSAFYAAILAFYSPPASKI